MSLYVYLKNDKIFFPSLNVLEFQEWIYLSNISYYFSKGASDYNQKMFSMISEFNKNIHLNFYEERKKKVVCKFFYIINYLQRFT